jgi:hypothetical protein
MTLTGRELEEAIRQGILPLEKALKRNAKASEELLDIAKQETMQIEVEAGPPVCPNCGVLNPTIYMEQEAGSGPLNEMIFKFEMHCCNKTVYAVPEGWQMSVLMQEVIDIIQQRAGVTNDRRS